MKYRDCKYMKNKNGRYLLTVQKPPRTAGIKRQHLINETFFPLRIEMLCICGVAIKYGRIARNVVLVVIEERL